MLQRVIPFSLVVLACAVAHAQTADGPEDGTPATPPPEEVESSDAAGADESVEDAPAADGAATDGAEPRGEEDDLPPGVTDEDLTLPPVDLNEQPWIPDTPRVDEEAPPEFDDEELHAWVPEASAQVGIYLTEEVQPGVVFGAAFTLAEHGPDTHRPHLDGALHVRRLLGGFDARFGFEPGEGLDEMDVSITPYGRRVESMTRDGSETRRTDLHLGVVRFGRSIDWDHQLVVAVSGIGADSRRDYQMDGPIRIGIDTRSTLLGFEHIEYGIRPFHYFNGVRIFSAGGDVIPTFDVNDAVAIRYVLGLDASLTLGSRNGALVGSRFASHSELAVHTGIGADITEYAAIDLDAAYRGTVDSLRTNRTGWLVTLALTGRY